MVFHGLHDRMNKTRRSKKSRVQYAIDAEYVGHPDVYRVATNGDTLSDRDSQKTEKRNEGLELAYAVPYKIQEVMCRKVRHITPLSEPNKNAQDAANVIYAIAQEQEDVEHFYVLLLNVRNMVTNYSIVTKGSVDAVLAHPRDIFRAAVYMNAKAIILGHTHPSGLPDPSREDIVITNQAREAGRILGIGVLDHIIVGMNRKLDAIGNAPYYSLAEHNQM